MDGVRSDDRKQWRYFRQVGYSNGQIRGRNIWRIFRIQFKEKLPVRCVLSERERERAVFPIKANFVFHRSSRRPFAIFSTVARRLGYCALFGAPSRASFLRPRGSTMPDRCFLPGYRPISNPVIPPRQIDTACPISDIETIFALTLAASLLNPHESSRRLFNPLASLANIYFHYHQRVSFLKCLWDFFFLAQFLTHFCFYFFYHSSEFLHTLRRRIYAQITEIWSFFFLLFENFLVEYNKRKILPYDANGLRNSLHQKLVYPRIRFN